MLKDAAASICVGGGEDAAARAKLPGALIIISASGQVFVRSGFQPLEAPGWRFYDTANCLCPGRKDD